jgi:hypothetical protein
VEDVTVMTAPAVTTDNRPLVGAYGDAYTAAENTPAPTSIDTPGAAWTRLGLISEDGATWTPPAEETAEIKAWQSAYPVRTVTTRLSTSVQFQLMEWDRDTLPFALGGGTFTDDGDLVTFHPPAAGEAASKALFVKVLDAPVKMGIYYAKGRVTERGDATFKTDEAALLDVTFAVEGQIGTEPYNLVFDAATFPAEGGAVAATGATAGTPGSFTPSGATVPANLAALSTVVANPATAWTTGQYVDLADASKAHWDASAWVAGMTP